MGWSPTHLLKSRGTPNIGDSFITWLWQFINMPQWDNSVCLTPFCSSVEEKQASGVQALNIMISHQTGWNSDLDLSLSYFIGRASSRSQLLCGVISFPWVGNWSCCCCCLRYRYLWEGGYCLLIALKLALFLSFTWKCFELRVGGKWTEPLNCYQIQNYAIYKKI